MWNPIAKFKAWRAAKKSQKNNDGLRSFSDNPNFDETNSVDQKLENVINEQIPLTSDEATNSNDFDQNDQNQASNDVNSSVKFEIDMDQLERSEIEEAKVEEPVNETEQQVTKVDQQEVPNLDWLNQTDENPIEMLEQKTYSYQPFVIDPNQSANNETNPFPKPGFEDLEELLGPQSQAETFAKELSSALEIDETTFTPEKENQSVLESLEPVNVETKTTLKAKKPVAKKTSSTKKPATKKATTGDKKVATKTSTTKKTSSTTSTKKPVAKKTSAKTKKS